jgi:uncharacterized RDD family membrane protein YckC
MEFNEDAKREIEKNLRDIVNNINLDNKDRIDIEKELRSTYYESAEAAPKETAASYMRSYASAMRRAGFWSRLAAFIIDNLILGVTIFILSFPMLILMLILNVPFTQSSDYSWMGHHSIPVLVMFFGIALVTIISDCIVGIGYYIVLEGHFGYTLGKYLMGLRVLKTDGTKIGYKESLLRNLSKYINNLIIIDTLIMLIFFNKEKQRGFDKIANTMVVHVR